ncbi:thioesterase family protein [Gordonia sp. CPCC 206044]|uniref:thioesterase family protein n=1 Tax=Gordonia sp. CPCC 206044 TaxID=3140793 RepID=UPI003AF34A81
MTEKLDQIRDLTEAGRDGDGRITYRTVIDPVFTIGPKVHGGSVQMVVARAARSALDALVPVGEAAEQKYPVAISSDYLSAPDPAEVDIEVTVRKTGRTVTVLTVDIVQGGRTMVASSVTCARPDVGAPRYSAPNLLDLMPVEPTRTALWLDGSPLEEVNHLGPALELALDPVTVPMVRGEKGDPVVRGWARPKGGEPDAEFGILIGDISVPVVMNLGLLGWAPTVQLTTYVRRYPAPGWLRFAATSTEVGPGMFEEDHLVVDSTGAVIVQTRQLALIPQGA